MHEHEPVSRLSQQGRKPIVQTGTGLLSHLQLGGVSYLMATRARNCL